MKKHFLLFLMAFMSITAWAQQNISGCSVQLSGDGLYTYDGTVKTVGLVVKVATATTAIDPSGYDVVYYAADGTTAVAAANLKNAGNYFAAAKGKESAGYTGETSKVAFTINSLLMTNSAISVTTEPTSPTFSYDGTEKKFTSVTVKFNTSTTLVENTDYTISYKDNILAGTAKLVVTGKGNFQGDKEVTFTIGAAHLPATTVAGAYTFTSLTKNPVYTGVEATTLPSLVVKNGEETLVEGTDYEIGWFAEGATAPLSKTVSGKTVYTKPVNAGTFTAKVYGKGGYDPSDVRENASWTLTIDKAPITVTPKDIEVEYTGASQANQTTKAQTAGQLEFSGIVSADAAKAAAIKDDIDFSAAEAGYGLTPGSSTTYGEAIVPGDYELIVQGVKMKSTLAEAKSANYQIGTYNKGTLTITKKVLKLKAANATKKVGEADPKFALTTTTTGITVSGGYDEDEITGVTFTRVSGEETDKTYEITPDFSAAKVERKKGTAVTDVTEYYEFALATPKGILTIEQGGILVTIKDANKFYGQADPNWTAVKGTNYTVSGLQDGDELAAFTIVRSEGEEPGTYSLTATVANPNPVKYATLDVSAGIFTINKAHLTVTLPAQNLKKNDLATALKKDGIVVTGINNSDVAEDLYTLDFNSTTASPTDGSIPTGDLTSSALNQDNATYNNGYKLTLKSGTGASAGKGAIDHYEILVKAASGSTPAVYESYITGKIIVGTGSTSAIAFTSVDADFATITGQSGETQNVTLTIAPRINREVPTGTKHVWAAQTWNTMVLPFDVTVADLSYALGYAIVNVVNPEKTTEGNVVFKLEMDKIPANTPFCVKTSEAITAAKTITFPNKVKIVAPSNEYPSVDAGQGYKFVGVYKGFEINNTTPDYYFLRGDNANWAHITSANTWQVVPFDAYIDQSGAAASARELTFTFEEIDGTTTSIKAVDANVVSNRTLKEGWYTIGGMKLQSAPTQKGVYINNGKKIIVK